MNTQKLETWTWVLIYGGLLTVCLAIFVLRQNPDDSHLVGGTMLAAGLIAAVVGVVLIYVRSRIAPPAAPPRNPGGNR